MDQTTNEFVTLKEAATSTRGSVKWLRREIKRGHLRAYLLGGKILIKAADLETFIASCSMTPVPENGVPGGV